MISNIVRPSKKVRNLKNLPVAERIEMMERICAYLTDKLCADLFPDANVTPALVPVTIAELPVLAAASAN